jgi:hypothetical protein
MMVATLAAAFALSEPVSTELETVLCGWAGAVGEGAGFGASLRVGLPAQPGQFGAQVSEQQVGEVVGESVADHDAQYGQVGAVFGEGVGGNEPAVFAQRCGPSKVEPRTATTPMVFSSQCATASTAVRWKRSPSIGISRGSTSQ